MTTTQANNANCRSPQKQTRSQNKGIWNRSRHRKDKIMTNSTNNINIHIGMNGEKLEEVISFRYLEPTMWDPTNPKYTNRLRRSGKMRIIGRLFD